MKHSKNTDRSTSTGTTGKQRTRRASLPVRIALTALAVVMLIGTGVIGVNIAAIGTYNQATQSLDHNLHDANAPNPDLDRLAARTQQTDSQFEDAKKFSPLLLPQIKDSIEHNTSVSQQLTGTTHRKLMRARHEAAKQDANGTASGQGTDTDGTQDQNGALSDEQRKQIEQMLKDNQSATSQGGDQTKRPPSDQPSKPW